jgi:hypothetical protein
MTAFVEHLTRVYGDRILAPIHREIETFAHPIAAIIEVLDDPPNVWWPGFFRHYVAGEYYQVGTAPFIDLAHVSGTFDTEVDRVETYLGTYRDFSAKIYRVVLGDTDVDPAARLEFEVESGDVANEDDLTVLLFTLENGELVFLTEGRDFVLEETPQLHAADVDLLAVVVNSAYTEPGFVSDSEVTLTIRYLEPGQDHGRVIVGVTGHWQNADGDAWDDFQSYTWSSRGTLNGNHYEGVPDPDVHGDAAVGLISILLDPGKSGVLSFSAELEIESFGITYTYTVGGQDVPFAEVLTDPPGTLHAVEGPACAASVESYTYMLEQTGGWWSGFTSFHCDESSFVEIRLVSLGKERRFRGRLRGPGDAVGPARAAPAD